MGVRWVDEVWVERRVDRAEGVGGEAGTREEVGGVVVVVVDMLTENFGLDYTNGSWR